MKLTTQGQFLTGKLVLHNEGLIRKFALKNDGKRVWVEIESIKAKRSLSQNSYYWGVVLPIFAESSGHTPAELHEIFKRMFLPPEMVLYKGKKIKIANTTTRLNKIEFGEYIERIKAEAAGQGIQIPEPDTLNPY